MRSRFWIFIAVALLSTTGVPAPAATFQNLDFEAYTGGSTMPSWQLVNQLANGTVLYQGEQPNFPYPFLGYHIGDGPVIGVNGGSPSFPNKLQGNFSITLSPNDPSFGGIVRTESAALAAKANVQEGGLAQTAEVPIWARSVWIATSTQFPSRLSPFVDLSFSNHRLELGLATAAQKTQMLAQAVLDSPPGLEDPLLPLDDPSTYFFAGNIESIAGRTRELKILPEPLTSPLGDSFGYQVVTQSITFDMIVFSSLPWDGPAVTVPEPQSMLALLTAIPAIWLARRAIA